MKANTNFIISLKPDFNNQ